VRHFVNHRAKEHPQIDEAENVFLHVSTEWLQRNLGMEARGELIHRDIGPFDVQPKKRSQLSTMMFSWEAFSSKHLTGAGEMPSCMDYGDVIPTGRREGMVAEVSGCIEER